MAPQSTAQIHKISTLCCETVQVLASYLCCSKMRMQHMVSIFLHYRFLLSWYRPNFQGTNWTLFNCNWAQLRILTSRHWTITNVDRYNTKSKYHRMIHWDLILVLHLINVMYRVIKSTVIYNFSRKKTPPTGTSIIMISLAWSVRSFSAAALKTAPLGTD